MPLTGQPGSRQRTKRTHLLPDGIFTESQVDDLVAILAEVRDRALEDLTVA